jgi:HNH endonuclease
VPRGATAQDGDERVAPNGYHYLKVNGKWQLKHHVIAAQTLGRPIRDTERVEFKDKNRHNFAPSNIQVVPRGKGSTRRRLAAIEARIDELVAERDELKKELGL